VKTLRDFFAIAEPDPEALRHVLMGWRILASEFGWNPNAVDLEAQICVPGVGWKAFGDLTTSDLNRTAMLS
jgi:hypothetical protein